MSKRAEIQRLEGLILLMRRLWTDSHPEDFKTEQWEQLAQMRVRLEQKLRGHRTGGRKKK